MQLNRLGTFCLVACLLTLSACARYEYKPKSPYEQAATITVEAGERGNATLNTVLNVLNSRQHDEYMYVVRIDSINGGRITTKESAQNNGAVYLSPGPNELALSIRSHGGKPATMKYVLDAQAGARYQLGINGEQAWIADAQGRLVKSFSYMTLRTFK